MRGPYTGTALALPARAPARRRTRRWRMASGSIDDALAWLAAERSAMEDLLRVLVERNSFTGNAAGVTWVVGALDAALRRLDESGGSSSTSGPLSCEWIESPRFGPHLFFRNAVPGAPVFLVGHADTVFPPGTFEGFRREGDRATGPGAFDMKGGLVVVRFALAAAARAGLLERVPVAGLIVSDEEVGSPESQPLLGERARGASCALVFESGRPGDLVVTRRKGVASLRAEAHGIAAHAGNEPEKGKSAIWSLARFVDRAQALSDPARGTSVNVGTIRGGTSKNTVPEHAECEVDLRFESVAARDALEAALGAGEAPLAGGGSDACTTAAAGVPSIDGLGPRGAGYHTSREEVDLGSLVPKAQALLRF